MRRTRQEEERSGRAATNMATHETLDQEMSKLEQFRGYINTLLRGAIADISTHYEKDIALCQKEVNRYKDEVAQLKNMLAIQPEIKLHRAGSTINYWGKSHY